MAEYRGYLLRHWKQRRLSGPQKPKRTQWAEDFHCTEGSIQKLNQPRRAGDIKKTDISPYRNCRDVWRINTVSYRGGHFAAYSPKLAQRCILAGCPEGGIVLDPFFGSGTTGLAALQNNRDYIGIELNEAYCALAEKRIYGEL